MNYFSKTNQEQEYGDWWRARQISRQQEKINLGGIEIEVDSKTFSPNPVETHSVQFLLDTFPDVKGRRVLDIGTGTGILAIYAANNGAAEVVATECDRNSFLNAQKNITRHNLNERVLCVHTNDFRDFGSFDIIMMNIIFASSPINSQEWAEKASSSLALHEMLIKLTPTILNRHGEIHLGFASFGDTEALEKLISNYSGKTSCRAINKFGVNWYHLILSS